MTASFDMFIKFITQFREIYIDLEKCCTRFYTIKECRTIAKWFCTMKSYVTEDKWNTHPMYCNRLTA